VTTPGNQGRFEGFDVLGQSHHWDIVTQGVVLRRLGPPAPLRFLTEDEGAVAQPLLDRLLGQDDDPRIDVLAEIDYRLALEITDGWHYDDMPGDGQAWRDTLAALDQDAKDEHGTGFARLAPEEQMRLIQRIQDCKDKWHGMPAAQVWSLWTRYACAAFYAHPWAWNEIGFGGPAYPRGYKNLGFDSRESWEKKERDARDPIPWATRTEQARKAHADRFGDGG
jgi:hypothetical protein